MAQKYIFFSLYGTYVLDSKTWNVSPYMDIGRPKVTNGSSIAMTKNEVVLIGGIKNDENDPIVSLSLRDKTWYIPKIENLNLLPSISNHSSISIPYSNRIFVIGGQSKNVDTNSIWEIVRGN